MVVVVDPRHTSQRCSRCGHTARNNRRSQSVFICRQCGYHLNADLNGARNIAAAYRASGGRSAVGGLLVRAAYRVHPIAPCIEVSCRLSPKCDRC
jgi:putative transposase